ncbi:hypothetical protein [Chitinophaga pinensis]|uniref:Uncharacterized protein n=1 Tax=Chitinophaga pinensis TaxID=79329 RepID=A0A5C6LT93_9BACT|nr:hypothetical protein [Chitinophaga pinensis]TWV98685.1 hypothetical protein FEF09_20605 [Chitinophaga pinensis]
MAIQTSIIPFTGRLGNLIGYRRNGVYYLRSMPQKVRQTMATCRAAKRFGIASKRGALLRKAIYGELDIPCDSSHITRLTAALIHTGVHNIRALQGFRFNQSAAISRFFAVTPVFSEDGHLHIPAQTLPIFKGIRTWAVKVIATRIDFNTRKTTGTDIAGITIDPRVPFNGANLSVSAPGNGTLVVVLQVQACSDQHPSQNKQLLTADIIAVQETKVAVVKTAAVAQTHIPVSEEQVLRPARAYKKLSPVQRE